MKSLESYRQYLINRGVPHSLLVGRSSITLKVVDDKTGKSKTYYENTGTLKPRYLNFVKEVKQVMTEGEEPVFNPEKTPISYIRNYEKAAGTYENVFEVDLNSAYWEAAYQLGFLPYSLYKKGQQVDKMARLISLGAGAAVRDCFRFDPETLEYTFVDTDQNQVGRSRFFQVCYEIDQMVMRSCDIHEALFFWVDAVFLKDRDSAESVVKFFGENAFTSKVIELSRVDIKHGQGTITYECTDMEGKMKPYTFPTERKRIDLKPMIQAPDEKDFFSEFF